MAGADADEILNPITPKVTSQMNEFLMADFTPEEVKVALDSIGDLKAPGADGLPTIFYKHYWRMIGDDVVREVHVLQGDSIPEGWNDTLVVLIPKVWNPERLKDLHPISLCNVVYKLVSKVLANRLKGILGEIISPNQSAFVPDRLISDNTILAYEMTHFLKRRRSGNTCYAALKLDMSKAYDRVEWAFLEKVMIQLGFSQGFVEQISKCMLTVRFRFKINGSCTDTVIPGQGLRQGDPISSSLFLICAEGLSALLNHAKSTGQIRGIRVAPDAQPVTHLLFADDSLLLM
ncbi:retrotransposon protein [Hordeum vulgare]|uniref:Reverse transcriptase domain-containing protein n=1 Tax=Hordeum vulgare subsp. vulgare TaxID=112509 RepID=A0A8I6WC28_HORVV|nr:retrotransposon protein [Hordeum vulgare]